MKFRWLPAPAQPLLAAQLARQFSLPPLLAQCLVNRQLDDPGIISGFLQPRLKHLSDPFLLADMDRAVQRLFQARERDESVVIFGDYDVDGVTSTALLLEFLRSMGWRVEYYLPHRLEEGYGLSLEAVERCLSRTPAQLLIAVDCGTTAVQCIAALRTRGIDVIVVDHHQSAAELPPAVALINPQVSRNSPASGVPSEAPRFAELCSVGLAFKLAHALLKHGRQTNLPLAADYDLRPLLELVALGTIADLVPLRNENRILVSAGLARLNNTSRPGLVALKKVARSVAPLGVHEVGFHLAPRLNAAGRLETAEEALQLLLASDPGDALARAEKLDGRNRERQQIERAIAEAVVGQVQAKFKPDDDFVIVEGDTQWHIGVVGIVAARVLRHFNRPTIIVGGDAAEWRGSGRSVAGFDLAAALGECADLLVRHGGHAMAAGLTIQRENIDGFRIRLNEVARRTLRMDELCPSLRLDSEVGLEEMSLDCVACLQRLNPTGQGNPPVHFYSKNLAHSRPLQRVGSDKKHVKMWVTNGAATREAMWFGAGNESLPVGRYDLAFVPQLNEYDGQRTVQLKVLDWRPAAP
jgi:single-stranded-DNA-specific exonuclease